MTVATQYELDVSVILAFHAKGLPPNEIANILADDGISYLKIKRVISANAPKYQIASNVRKAFRRDEYFPCTCEKAAPVANGK